MKRYLLSIMFFALCMLVTAAGASTITASGGILPPGSTGVFPVAVGDLTDAEGVTFNLTFDNTCCRLRASRPTAPSRVLRSMKTSIT
jgi:hypothetical protein